MDATLVQQAENLAAEVFLDKLQQGEYGDNIDLENYSLKILNALMNATSTEESSFEFKQMIYSKVIEQLLSSWVSEQLRVDKVNEYLEKKVFETVNTLSDTLKSRIWAHETDVNMNELKLEVKELQATVTKLSGMLENLTQKKREQHNTTMKSTFF